MSKINAENYLKQYDLDKSIITLKTSTATVSDAAKSLKCSEARIAKTLSLNLNGDTILIVSSGDSYIDNNKYKQYFHTKPKMLQKEEVESKVGHKIGGVCPFGINEGVKVYLDISLKRFETVYPSCGSDHNAIELTIPLLEKITKYPIWIDVCKTK